MVDTLRAGPYALPVVPLYAGPLLEEDGEAAPLARLLNHAVELPAGGMAEAIEAGRECGDAMVYVARPADAEADRELQEAWTARTGERPEPGTVARVAGAGGAEAGIPVSWAVLRQALAELRRIRAAWRPEPGPWLFRRSARAPFVTPEDRALVRALEAEAGEIDALDLEAAVGREPPDLVRRRRDFLARCSDAGIFAADHAPVRVQWLHGWSADRLLALRRAAEALAEWGFLPPGADPGESPVALDYVRLRLWPPGDDGEQTARRVLPLLRPDESGEQGMVVERVGGATLRAWWRRDGARPALLAVERG